MEHRWGIRQTLDVGVTLYVESKLPSFGRLVNASSSGAYVATNAALPVMTRVRLALGRDRALRGGHRICAYVVRADSRGMGIEWQEFAPWRVVALINAIEALPRRAGAQALPGGFRPVTESGAPGVYLPAMRSTTALGSVYSEW